MANPQSDKKLVSKLPSWLATVFVLAVAFGLVAAQPEYSNDPKPEFSLSYFQLRVRFLRSITNLAIRDSYCISASGYGRQLDQLIAPDAKVFMSEMLGETNGGRIGLYYFMRNYLFPRQVDISLDGKGVLTETGAVGVVCDSPELLREHGYDLLLAPARGGLEPIPLSRKGAPR